MIAARSVVSAAAQQALIAIVVVAIACRENRVPTAAPRSVSFGRIVASDTIGCFELVPDRAASPRPMAGVPGLPMPYEPPRHFELKLEGDSPPRAIATALSPDSNGVRPVGWFASSREELVIGWGRQIVVVRKYPDGALRAKLGGMIWLVQRRSCSISEG